MAMELEHGRQLEMGGTLLKAIILHMLEMAKSKTWKDRWCRDMSFGNKLTDTIFYNHHQRWFGNKDVRIGWKKSPKMHQHQPS